jgi:hypothetical protein
MKLIRNAVWLYTIAIAMFIFSIFTIGLYFFLGKTVLITGIGLSFFIIALLSVLVGIIHAAKEVWLGFDILTIETKNII